MADVPRGTMTADVPRETCSTGSTECSTGVPRETISLNYSKIFAQRAEKLEKLRADPELLAAVKHHYRSHPDDFINDWVLTFDPRKVSTGELATMPFILWPRQREFVRWMYARWQGKERGFVEKSRDCGVTWLSCAVVVCLWAFRDGFSAGFGSRKEQLVDRLGDMDSIFEKIRFIIKHLPPELLPPGFSYSRDATYMRILSPTTGATITGESGDNIGRGGRSSLYIVDEKAFIERQERVDAALSANTDCQIDISTFNGSGNLFYRQIQQFQGSDQHFVFDWRDDPRKDMEWYEKKKRELPEEILAQEIDRDPNAAQSDSFILAKWVRSAIDAHLKLGFSGEGIRTCGFDPADTGDAKGLVLRHGSVVEVAEELTKGDITLAIPWAYGKADEYRADLFIFDADGLGAPSIKLGLQHAPESRMSIVAYRGSGEVEGKDQPEVAGDVHGRKNGDVYENFRAQSWTWLRERFKKTYDAVKAAEAGTVVIANPEELISISSLCGNLTELVSEVSRPKRIYSNNGKVKVESKRDMKARGIQSPNLADALVMAFSRSVAKRERRRPVYRSHRVRDSLVGY